ncbi:glycosyltransferase family 9 protein [candidate division KSB1 bacterium]|nr:glycosyltransferase family 9 protein [candidate division KSB1 bacterium]NIR72244.1 glycosyltransferase family 9 protein [candidate division KSB1 bacterium]NIS23874.1 glycosyltransferase family 9 protein [candidate division KSB1 bacterium]NIT70795.1 glycosyltransferase family 9 protein [candidate division KSB1 bacterium]NIU24523.1 glycosyltransferase family 9 protein [candidate division KSB1 bacterium]
MLKKFSTNAVGSFLRVKNRFLNKSPSVEFIRQLAATKKVLIFMPNKIENFGIALKSLNQLREHKPDWQITVVTKVEMVSFIDNRLKVDILPYSNDDSSILGLPKGSLREHFDKQSYDLALDFEPTFDLICIKLFEFSDAKVKVCFDSPDKSPFYNFSIRVNPVESLENKYGAMIKYLVVISQSKIQKKAVEDTH